MKLSKTLSDWHFYYPSPEQKERHYLTFNGFPNKTFLLLLLIRISLNLPLSFLFTYSCLRRHFSVDLHFREVMYLLILFHGFSLFLFSFFISFFKKQSFVVSTLERAERKTRWSQYRHLFRFGVDEDTDFLKTGPSVQVTIKKERLL